MGVGTLDERRSVVSLGTHQPFLPVKMRVIKSMETGKLRRQTTGIESLSLWFQSVQGITE